MVQNTPPFDATTRHPSHQQTCVHDFRQQHKTVNNLLSVCGGGRMGDGHNDSARRAQGQWVSKVYQLGMLIVHCKRVAG